MKIDCSKLSNKEDAVTLFGMVLILAAFAFAIYLSIFVRSFWGGYVSATIVWKWKDWIFTPLDRWLDRCWPEQLNTVGRNRNE
jgi:hypothetical protein